MGFEILDFPCDQFEHQAPGTNEEIVAFCDANFGITFTHYGISQSSALLPLHSADGYRSS